MCQDSQDLLRPRSPSYGMSSEPFERALRSHVWPEVSRAPGPRKKRVDRALRIVDFWNSQVL